MKKALFSILLMLFALTAVANEPQTSPTQVQTEEEKRQAYLTWANELWNSLERKTGTVAIAEANAELNVPESFYYLSPSDAEKVLVDVWGNPPGQNTLGMLLPSNVTPFDSDAWAVTIRYEEDGYVSDDDADEIDYNDLLSQMKKDTRSASKERVKMGYEPMELIGWAEPPYYDNASHKLHWAKELKVGSNTMNTLNYNIRILGRRGVLVLNFIAGMESKPTIDQNINTVLAMAEFNRGATYSEFDPDLDEVAAYGLGALVAGKVAAKAGILAGLLIFLKKFGVLLLVGLGAVGKTLFKRKKETN